MISYTAGDILSTHRAKKNDHGTQPKPTSQEDHLQVPCTKNHQQAWGGKCGDYDDIVLVIMLYLSIQTSFNTQFLSGGLNTLNHEKDCDLM